MKSMGCTFLLLVALLANTVAQDAAIFPKGEKSPNVHHTGNVWLYELAKVDSVLDCQVAQASFDAGTKLDWHHHPGGQILLVTEGVGYYQEKGKQKLTVKKGDVIKCMPGVEHWHGATPQQGFVYIAINTHAAKGKTVWGQQVTDVEYLGSTPMQATYVNEEQAVIDLSKAKWQWMADKNTDSLAMLFHDKSMFVHMGGSWGKEREINVIKSGGIHYKKTDIHEVSVKIMDNTAILLNKITLLAVVGGNEVTNPFMVTEVYVKQNSKWILGSLSFTKLLTQ